MELNIQKLFIVSTVIMSVNFTVNADTLSNLKSVLTSLNGNSAINVAFSNSYIQSNGEKNDLELKNGLITLPLSYSDKGLQITYTTTILDQITKEETLKEQDDDADTPTLNAISDIEASDILEMMSSATSLLRFINKAKLIAEKQVLYQDKPATELLFELPVESIIRKEKSRNNIDEFKGKYKIVINSQGIPVEDHLSFNGNGSAFVFFNFEMDQTLSNQYKKVGERLVNIHQSYTIKQSSTVGDSETSGEKNLTIID